VNGVAWHQLLTVARDNGTLPALTTAIDQADQMAEGLAWHLGQPVRCAWLLSVAAMAAEDQATRDTLQAAAGVMALDWHSRMRIDQLVASVRVADTIELITGDGSEGEAGLL
jgi:hypothetical protein